MKDKDFNLLYLTKLGAVALIVCICIAGMDVQWTAHTVLNSGITLAWIVIALGAVLYAVISAHKPKIKITKTRRISNFENSGYIPPPPPDRGTSTKVPSNK